MTRIAILGAGAIGSVLGAFLHRGGQDVTLIGRPDHIRAIRHEGLQVDGIAGSFIAAVPAAEALDFQPDFLFLAVKTQDVLSALQTNIEYLRDATVVTFQNGVRSDELAATLISPGRIISAVVNISASFLTSGRVIVTYPGSLVIGRPFGKPDPELDSLAAALRLVSPTSISTNIQGVHWLKLIFNLNNAFPALLNQPLHEIYADPFLRRLAARVMREGLRTVTRAGVRLESLPEASVGLFRVLAALPAPLAGALIAWRARGIESEWPLLGSTLQSLRRGRPTEIDYLNGEIVGLGSAVGLQTPLNAALVEMVHEVENGRAFWTAGQIRSRLEAAPG
jgi:2-dehydropantoate 2-reductase